MLRDSKAFSGFATNDLDAAQAFYGDTLGLDVERWNEHLLALHLTGGRDTLVYAKPDFTPATYTILNFPVEDVEAVVKGLAARGVTFERYDAFDQDEHGISRGEGPPIAWFKDPAGNILSVLEES